MNQNPKEEIERRGRASYCRICGRKMIWDSAVRHVRNHWRVLFPKRKKAA